MLSKLFRRIVKFAWLIPGFLLWAAFPPMGETQDIVVALAPLMWFSRRKDASESAWMWAKNGFLFWFATLSWMPAIVKNNGPWPLVVLGWLALAAYCSLFFAAYGWLSAKYWRWARNLGPFVENGNTVSAPYWRRLLGVLIVEPVLWCGLELVRCRFLGGFAWNQLGVVPVNAGFGAPAALGGVYLCSAVVILVNGTIAGIAERMWRPELSGFVNLKRLGTLETILAFVLIFSVYQASPSFAKATEGNQTSQTSQTSQAFLNVAMIQRNFPCCFKEREEHPYAVYERLLSNVSMLKPDLVVLPESAMCEFGAVDSPRAFAFADWVSERSSNASLLAGGSRRSAQGEFNSAALYSNPMSEESLQIYDKVHLVPFGEFIPGDKWFPFLQQFAPVGSCTPGELKLLQLPLIACGRSVPLGVAICFEDTDSPQMRRLAEQGAQVLFFITNDSWFSHSIEAEQHAWQAVARAIETGLPVVRVGNSGVTGTITPDGKAVWTCDVNGKPIVDEAVSMFGRVAIFEGSDLTFYVRFGDLPLIILFSLLITAMVMVKYISKYEKRRTLSMQIR